MANSPDLNPERFFKDLYDKTREWLMVSRGASEVASFAPQVVRRWSFSDSYSRDQSRLPLDLQKGNLLHERPLTTDIFLSREKGHQINREIQLLVFSSDFYQESYYITPQTIWNKPG